MSAPEAVVRAVMKRLGCVRDVDCNGHHYCLAHYYGWLHDADTCPHAEAGADAAYAATLAVLRDLIRADGPEGDAARGALGLSIDAEQKPSRAWMTVEVDGSVSTSGGRLSDTRTRVVSEWSPWTPGAEYGDPEPEREEAPL